MNEDILKQFEGLTPSQLKAMRQKVLEALPAIRTEVTGEELLIGVTATKQHLGNVTNDMARQYGYTPSMWQAGEVRNLPAEIAKQLLSSEGFRAAREGDKRIYWKEVRNPAPSASGGDAELQMLKARYASEPQVTCVCVMGGSLPGNGWKDGGMMLNFQAAGYPCEWHRGEIRTIPKSLYRILQSDGVVTADEGEVKARKGVQKAFELYRAEWQKEQERKRAEAARELAEQDVMRRMELKQAQQKDKERQTIYNEVLKELK